MRVMRAVSLILALTGVAQSQAAPTMQGGTDPPPGPGEGHVHVSSPPLVLRAKVTMAEGQLASVTGTNVRLVLQLACERGTGTGQSGGGAAWPDGWMECLSPVAPAPDDPPIEYVNLHGFDVDIGGKVIHGSTGTNGYEALYPFGGDATAATRSFTLRFSSTHFVNGALPVRLTVHFQVARAGQTPTDVDVATLDLPLTVYNKALVFATDETTVNGNGGWWYAKDTRTTDKADEPVKAKECADLAQAKLKEQEVNHLILGGSTPTNAYTRSVIEPLLKQMTCFFAVTHGFAQPNPNSKLQDPSSTAFRWGSGPRTEWWSGDRCRQTTSCPRSSRRP